MGVKQKENGFHLVIVLLLLAAIVVIGVIGYVFFNKYNQANADVKWSFDEKKLEWYVSEGSAPACLEPLVFDYDPLDLTKVNSIGMPGLYISKSYKVHGGMRVLIESKGQVGIKLPMDGTLTGLKRYYDGNTSDVQYLVSFENDCGIGIYFDHLNKLSPTLQKLADQTPEPTINDTRSSPDDAPPRTKFKAGEVIATAIGFPQSDNYGFDFGVLDYRQRNEISKNSKWAEIHDRFEASEWYGVCWLDMLPGAKKAKTLIKLQTDTRRVQKFVSDYCEEGDYTTLDFNNGQPVDQY
jgi:hypothetical protein